MEDKQLGTASVLRGTRVKLWFIYARALSVLCCHIRNQLSPGGFPQHAPS